MAEEMRGRVFGGEGKEAEIDGGYFSGYVKPANLKEDRKDRRFSRNQNGKRKVVVIIRERGGASVPAVFASDVRLVLARPEDAFGTGSLVVQMAMTVVQAEALVQDVQKMIDRLLGSRPTGRTN